MIVKEWVGKATTDIKLQAGQKAEKQMAFYLKREFGKDKNIFVFNDLRIKHEGEVAQIDHLILHTYGFSLIESKSITGSVEVNEHGEWVRKFNNKPTGMRSPLIQLDMQKKILISFLNDNANKILGKILWMQQGVGKRKFDCITAISDQAIIIRKQEIENVYKADVVAGNLRERIKKHKRDVIIGDSVWFNKNEIESIKNFLLENDHPKDKLAKQFKKETALKNTLSKQNKLKSKLKNEISEPQTTYKTTQNYWQCKCGERYDVRYANTARYGKSFYRYCFKCRGREPLIAECPECQSNIELELIERITTYACSKNTKHHGIFYKNEKLWLKDKKKLASEK